MPASMGFLAAEITGEHILACHRARTLVEHDAAWQEWRELSGGAWYLWVESRDGDRPFRRVRDGELTYAVGVARILRAERDGRLVAEWLAIFGEMADYWAERSGTDHPPPRPDAGAALPPEAEEGLAMIGAQLVVDEAENGWIDDLLEGDETPGGTSV